MFLLQKKLNDSTNGNNWELGVNKFGKEINWLRCIHMEVAELIESTPRKHWKNINSDPDMIFYIVSYCIFTCIQANSICIISTCPQA